MSETTHLRALGAALSSVSPVGPQPYSDIKLPRRRRADQHIAAGIVPFSVGRCCRCRPGKPALTAAVGRCPDHADRRSPRTLVPNRRLYRSSLRALSLRANSVFGTADWLPKGAALIAEYASEIDAQRPTVSWTASGSVPVPYDTLSCHGPEP